MKVSMPSGSTHGWGIAGSHLSAEIARLAPLDGVTLHCISGHDFWPFDETAWNRINIGYCFFEYELLAHPFIAEASKRWDHIVAGSTWCEDKLRRGGMTRTSTILQGIDASLFKRQPPRRKDGRFIVFSGGKFEYRKGQDIVIAAMKIFMERHQDVWLSCSWHNHWPASLKTMENSRLIEFTWREAPCNELLIDTIITNGLDPARVILHPAFDNHRMPLIYAESDIGIFPNRCEGGNNLVMCEYMACGRTVIASDQTGHADVISPENAFCLHANETETIRFGDLPVAAWPQPSPEELLEKLEEAYTNRAAIITKADTAARDMSRLTWASAAQQFHHIAVTVSGTSQNSLMRPSADLKGLRHEAEDLFAAGSYEDAETCYRNMISASPFDASLHNSMATVLDCQKRYQEACAYYHKALSLDSGCPDIRCNMANSLARAGRPDQAITELRELVANDPRSIRGWKTLGHHLDNAGRTEEAIHPFEQLVQLDPADVESWTELARLWERLREYEKAVSCLERALALDPDNVGLLNNQGLLLHEMEQLDAAETAFTRALAQDPGNAAVCNNMGNISKSRLNFNDAIAWYNRALEQDPANATILFNRTLAFLARGEMPQGWKWFECRFKMVPPVVIPEHHLPRWNGTPLCGRRLLIQSEQVYGDTLMFVRFALTATEYGGKVLLECQDRSIRSALTSLEGKVELLVRGESFPVPDLQIPLLSLPGIFGTTLDTIPSASGYLAADPARVACWGDIIGPGEGMLRVGLVWGGRKAPLNADRSLQLRLLEPILSLPGIRFFSLQLGDDLQQLDPYRSRITDLSPHLRDFGETAAAVANLDLVITIDTAIAHLAGAMGKPVWVLLKYSPDWRWLLDRSDSPWYDSAYLFRQPGYRSGWAPLVQAVQEKLLTELANHKKSAKDSTDRCR